MSDESRFSAPTDVIHLRRLVGENYRVVLIGLLISIALLALGVIYLVAVPREAKAPPPAIARLIIRKPRSTKAFELKRKRLIPRAMTKQVTTLKPRLITPSVRRFTAPSVFGRVATFNYAVDTNVQINLQMSPIQLSAATVTGTKEPEKRIALREELLDLKALDTGKYKGLVIQDPTDRQKVKGFVYLATAWGNDLKPTFPSAAKAIPTLVDAINAQTGITARVDDHLFIDSAELFRTPFVYITADEAFELTEREIKSLGEYMQRGGFIFADNAVPTAEYGPAEASLRQMFRDALGVQGQLQRIPNSHPIYHSFYDFDGPPVGEEMGGSTLSGSSSGVRISYEGGTFVPKPVYFLEGVFLKDRLVAIYSDKGYCHMWAKNFGNEPQLRFGINVVIFALTQKGSIARQQIDFFSQISE